MMTARPTHRVDSIVYAQVLKQNFKQYTTTIYLNLLFFLILLYTWETHKK